MTYKKAIEVFEKLPPEKQTLIRVTYARNGMCCAIGMLCPEMTQMDECLLGDDVHGLLESQKTRKEAAILTARLAELGMTVEEAACLQSVNDSSAGAEYKWNSRWGVVDASVRFKRVLDWMKAQEHSHEGGPDSEP